LFFVIISIALSYASLSICFTFSSIFLIVSSDIYGFSQAPEYESIVHSKFSAQISGYIPYLVTIFLAMLVALSISLLAQVVILSFQ